MYTYKIKEITKVVDGDTLDAIIDLGFGITKKERIRIAAIDAPETRTHNLHEKKLGFEAKAWLKKHVEYCDNVIIKTEKEGKYGRILGIPKTDDGQSMCDILVAEGHAVEYWGGKKLAKVQEDGTWRV